MANSSYEKEPLVALSYWSVYEVPLHGADAPWTRHFVGFAKDLGLAQVSSAILMFDPEHGVGAAASHRVFQLVGDSGRHQESASMWARWKFLKKVQQERDVTYSFSREMQEERRSARL